MSQHLQTTHSQRQIVVEQTNMHNFERQLLPCRLKRLHKVLQNLGVLNDDKLQNYIFHLFQRLAQILIQTHDIHDKQDGVDVNMCYNFYTFVHVVASFHASFPKIQLYLHLHWVLVFDIHYYIEPFNYLLLSITPLEGTPKPPVTIDSSTSLICVVDVPRIWRTPSTIKFIPCT